MRQRLLSLLAVALLAGACAGSASGTTGPDSGGNEPPQHHGATQPPRYVPDETRPPADPDVPEQAETDPDDDEVSTFGLDIDTASYTMARQAVDAGVWPNAASVRVEEWVNAFEQGYERPTDGTFAIAVDGGPTPFTGEDERLLRVGIAARDVRDQARDDAALTFVIDTSGSMEQQGRLELVKDALRVLVGELRPDDTIAIVTFGSDARVILEPTSAAESWEILDEIDRLRPDGSTNLEAGLRLGYELARESLTENGIDRVILASDGVANVGLTDPEGILERIREDAAAGIELVSIGVGMGDYNDVLLEQLSNEGDGFYAYVNDVAEAERLFIEDLTGSLQAIALDARAQVEFDGDAVASYRLLGYENRAIDDDDFTDDSVDAGAIGAGHEVTALYALRLQHGVAEDDRLAVVRLRWTDPERDEPFEVATPVRLREVSTSFRQTSPHLRFDALVAATAEILRGSSSAPRIGFDELADLASELEEDLPATDQVHDFLILLDGLSAMER
jgi:Ca-activated chloride channel family protein